MFKIKVSIQAFIKGIIKSYFKVPYSNPKGAFFMTVVLTAAIAGVISDNTILFWIGIVADLFLLLVFFFSTIEEIQTEYYNLTTDIDSLPNGSHIINKRLGKKIKVNIVDGKIHGEFLEYYRGQLKFSKTYKNGVKNGPFKTYYIDGRPKMSDKYGKKQLKSSTEYKDGVQHGEELLYDPNGQLVRKSQIEKGDLLIKTEYFSNGEIRLINRSNLYEFYGWDSDLNKSLIKCKIDIVVIHKPKNYGSSEVAGSRFDGIWTNFNSDGSIDYELKFNKTNNDISSVKEKTAEKIIYNKSQEIISSNLVKCYLKEESDLSFHSAFEDSRLLVKWDGKYFHSFSTGIKGPPGVGYKEIEIRNINSLEDILEIVDITDNKIKMAKNISKAKFCGNCGEKTVNQKFCPKCGEKTNI